MHHEHTAADPDRPARRASQRVCRATGSEALAAWFAEHADVSLDERRYDFWGRFSPGMPDREAGRHPLLAVVAERRLQYAWSDAPGDGTVTLRLEPRPDGGASVLLEQAGMPANPAIAKFNLEDFWFLSLENLRRYTDGRAEHVVRCDFSNFTTGPIEHSVEIDASPETVFGALIRPEQLNRWIASQALVEPHVGGRYELGWENFGSLKILELNPDCKLVLSVPDELGTIVTWTLEGSGGRTRLTLVHSGFTPEKPGTDLIGGWLNFMSWIKSMSEYGPAWQPSVKRLTPEMASYYSAAIGAGQSRLLPDEVSAAS